MRFVFFFQFILVLLAAQGAAACGADSDCRIGDRHYRIAWPEDARAPVGAIVFAHGYRGSAAAVMRNSGLRRMAAEEGLALIALKSLDRDWVIPHAPGHAGTDGAREFAYVEAVLADVARRYPLDTGRVMGAGFSSGAMLIWNLACAMPERFAGFVAVAGTFWQRPPARCATPVESLVHIHGQSDPTVPLTGRAIRETWQGDVREALSMYRRLGGFHAAQPAGIEGLTCEGWRNARGEILDFCLHPGGHSLRTAYIRAGLDRLREAGQM
ncbi:alpha/beta hydrolase family esterase [Roseovarius nitratireducens]|uniref:alpha/beta hydrolase family esterase n=1 Tax=Roseovarius nitratireducens TaxID=2044597 RepID=UPI000CE263BD|nr:alpha/beta fold hydrolase [Roseovarius nitratireducens]